MIFERDTNSPFVVLDEALWAFLVERPASDCHYPWMGALYGR
jgi:hypothetical protein